MWMRYVWRCQLGCITAVGMTCLKAGVHVLIEKPIAASIAEAESLVNAAADYELHFCRWDILSGFNPAF